MKVKLLTAISGANGAFNVGDEYPCTADEAGRLIEAGFAEAIREVRKETASRKPKVEKAAK